MYLLILLLPLLGSSAAGAFGPFLGSEGSAIVSTTSLSLSSISSLTPSYEVALGASACYPKARGSYPKSLMLLVRLLKKAYCC